MAAESLESLETELDYELRTDSWTEAAAILARICTTLRERAAVNPPLAPAAAAAASSRLALRLAQRADCFLRMTPATADNAREALSIADDAVTTDSTCLEARFVLLRALRLATDNASRRRIPQEILITEALCARADSAPGVVPGKIGAKRVLLDLDEDTLLQLFRETVPLDPLLSEHASAMIAFGNWNGPGARYWAPDTVMESKWSVLGPGAKQPAVHSLESLFSRHPGGGLYILIGLPGTTVTLTQKMASLQYRPHHLIFINVDFEFSRMPLELTGALELGLFPHSSITCSHCRFDWDNDDHPALVLRGMRAALINCTFRGNGQGDGAVAADASALTVSGSRMDNCRGAIVGLNTALVNVFQTMFVNCQGTAVRVSNAAEVASAAVVIVNSEFRDNDCAVELENVGARLLSNRFEENVRGIAIRRATHCAVSDNQFLLNGDRYALSVISPQTDIFEIVGNVFDTTSEEAYAVTDAPSYVFPCANSFGVPSDAFPPMVLQQHVGRMDNEDAYLYNSVYSNARTFFTYNPCQLFATPAVNLIDGAPATVGALPNLRFLQLDTADVRHLLATMAAIGQTTQSQATYYFSDNYAGSLARSLLILQLIADGADADDVLSVWTSLNLSPKAETALRSALERLARGTPAWISFATDTMHRSIAPYFAWWRDCIVRLDDLKAAREACLPDCGSLGTARAIVEQLGMRSDHAVYNDMINLFMDGVWNPAWSAANVSLLGIVDEDSPLRYEAPVMLSIFRVLPFNTSLLSLEQMQEVARKRMHFWTLSVQRMLEQRRLNVVVVMGEALEVLDSKHVISGDGLFDAIHVSQLPDRVSLPATLCSTLPLLRPHGQLLAETCAREELGAYLQAATGINAELLERVWRVRISEKTSGLPSVKRLYFSRAVAETVPVFTQQRVTLEMTQLRPFFQRPHTAVHGNWALSPLTLLRWLLHLSPVIAVDALRNQVINSPEIRQLLELETAVADKKDGTPTSPLLYLECTLSVQQYQLLLARPLRIVRYDDRQPVIYDVITWLPRDGKHYFAVVTTAADQMAAGNATWHVHVIDGHDIYVGPLTRCATKPADLIVLPRRRMFDPPAHIRGRLDLKDVPPTINLHRDVYYIDVVLPWPVEAGLPRLQNLGRKRGIDIQHPTERDVHVWIPLEAPVYEANPRNRVVGFHSQLSLELPVDDTPPLPRTRSQEPQPSGSSSSPITPSPTATPPTLPSGGPASGGTSGAGVTSGSGSTEGGRVAIDMTVEMETVDVALMPADSIVDASESNAEVKIRNLTRLLQLAADHIQRTEETMRIQQVQRQTLQHTKLRDYTIKRRLDMRKASDGKVVARGLFSAVMAVEFASQQRYTASDGSINVVDSRVYALKVARDQPHDTPTQDSVVVRSRHGREFEQPCPPCDAILPLLHVFTDVVPDNHPLRDLPGLSELRGKRLFGVMDMLDVPLTSEAERLGMRIDRSWLLAVTIQMLRGVRHLVLNNVLHMDLKPDNFVVRGRQYEQASRTDDLEVVMIDLGLHVSVPNLQDVDWERYRDDFKHGNTHHRAPEFALDKEDRNLSKAEVYSVGIILTNLLLISLRMPWDESYRRGLPLDRSKLRPDLHPIDALRVLLLQPTPTQRPSADEALFLARCLLWGPSIGGVLEALSTPAMAGTPTAATTIGAGGFGAGAGFGATAPAVAAAAVARIEEWRTATPVVQLAQTTLERNNHALVEHVIHMNATRAVEIIRRWGPALVSGGGR